MRINVYSQELITDNASLSGPMYETVTQISNTGAMYSAVRLFLHSSYLLHHPPADDDRSAVTFWLPHSPQRRKVFADALRTLAGMVEAAPRETGLD